MFRASLTTGGTVAADKLSNEKEENLTIVTSPI